MAPMLRTVCLVAPLLLAVTAVLPVAALAQAPAGAAPAVGSPPVSAPPVLAPPVAPREPKTTVLHGDTLVDDYAWLREKGTPRVEEYLRAERAYAEAFMAPTAALQQELYDEMVGRIQQTDVDVPYLDRGYYYYTRTEEGKQYSIHARRKGSLEAPEEVILDLNALAAGKAYLGLGAKAVSPDGNLLAYTTDDTGFRQYRLHVVDLTTGALRPDTAERVTALVWAEDGKTLLYGVEDAQTKRSHQVWRLTLGDATPQLVFEEPDERFDVWVSKSLDDRWLLLQTDSHTTSETRIAPASAPAGEWRLVAAREPGHEYDVEVHGETLWIRTNDKGRNFRLVTAPIARPGREGWQEVIAHRDDVMLAGHWLFEDFYLLMERAGGFPRLRVTDLRSGQSHHVEMPEQAAAIQPTGNAEHTTPTFRFVYQSPIAPPSIYDYDPATRVRTLRKQVAVLGGYDPARYAVEVTHATAKDGVAVPIWMVHRKGLARDGSNPVVLNAYGSYGSADSPRFDPNVFSLLDRGVIWAVAYIRGGGELGKKWHDDGRMLNKMNTFTDFVAAAEHLVAARYTSPERLGIRGGSAGGLLMGAVTNLRPDLFGAVVSRAPFVDVINTMLDETLPLTVGEFEEWGNPKVAEHYRAMRQYSPYENVAPRDYPAILVKAAYNDSQVMYWEPAKYVARMRANRVDADDDPLLFRINLEPAGHSGTSGRYDRLRELAFDYAFLLWHLGVEAPALPLPGEAETLTSSPPPTAPAASAPPARR